MILSETYFLLALSPKTIYNIIQTMPIKNVIPVSLPVISSQD